MVCHKVLFSSTGKSELTNRIFIWFPERFRNVIFCTLQMTILYDLKQFENK